MVATARNVVGNPDRVLLTSNQVAAQLGIAKGSEKMTELNALWTAMEAAYQASIDQHVEGTTLPIQVPRVSRPLPVMANVETTEQGEKKLVPGSLRLAEDKIARLGFALGLTALPEVSARRRPPTSAQPAIAIPDGFKSLKDVENSCGAQYPALRDYWAHFIAYANKQIRFDFAAVPRGVRCVDVQTQDAEGNPLELQYIHSFGASGKPEMFLNFGANNERLDTWLRAAAAYETQSFFDQPSIKVKKVVPLADTPCVGQAQGR
jgi:hypothetical protein